MRSVSYTHLRAHETVLDLVCRLLLEKQKNKKDELINEVKSLEIYKKVMEKFPDAELIDVKLNKKQED